MRIDLDSWEEILSTITRNKARSLLTAFGVFWGIFMLVGMLGGGNGLEDMLSKNFSGFATNSAFIFPGRTEKAYKGFKKGRSWSLETADIERLRHAIPELDIITPVLARYGETAVAGEQKYTCMLRGMYPDLGKVSENDIRYGRELNDMDITEERKVCVIGKTIADNLFPDGTDPIGKVIRCNKIPFRIVGVLKSKGYNSMGMDQDDIVLAPYTTVMKRLLAQTYLSGIFASALTEDMTDNAIEEITTILRREHKLKSTDEDDFRIRSQQELSSMLNTTTDLMTTLLACIAGISLVVGGIGIMNIMYVSVTERTKEIGLRMSVGARGIDILSQFLIESILISITGGLIGVLIGCGASFIIKNVAHWPVFIQPWSVLLSFAVCTFTGIFFGWYPAKKAADLDPIEALRYE